MNEPDYEQKLRDTVAIEAFGVLIAEQAAKPMLLGSKDWPGRLLWCAQEAQQAAEVFMREWEKANLKAL